MCALLIVEILVFSIRIDTANLDAVNSAWASALRESAFLVNLGITGVIALLVFGGDRLSQFLSAFAERRDAEGIRWSPLAAHLIAVLALYQLSGKVFGDEIRTAAHPGIWFVGWLMIGISAIAFWIIAIAPYSLWRTIALSTAKVSAACLLLAFVAVAAGKLANTLWEPLAEWTFAIVAFLLQLLYPEVVTQPHDLVVGTGDYSVRIAAGCSGFEGIGLVTVFLSAYLFWFRRSLRFPQAILLLPIGIVLIWIANSLRIAGLVIVGTSISREIAAGGFHSQAGWLAFNAVTLGLVALAGRSEFFSNAPVTRSSMRDMRPSYAAAPYLIPFLVLVLGAMLTSIVSIAGFDRLYGLRVLAAGAALVYFVNVYRRREILTVSWSWPAIAIGGLVFVIWMVLEPLANVSHTDRSNHAAAVANLSPIATFTWIGFRIVGSVLIVPMAEELAFRGFLTRRLISENFESVPTGTFSWVSFVVSSLVFGLLHGRWLAGSLAGMFYAAALYRRGRLSDAVLAHATTNTLVTLYVLTTGSWSTWS